MEHICFEVQLCIKISIFKEKHVFDILIILCLGTSLAYSGVEIFRNLNLAPLVFERNSPKLKTGKSILDMRQFGQIPTAKQIFAKLSLGVAKQNFANQIFGLSVIPEHALRQT